MKLLEDIKNVNLCKKWLILAVVSLSFAGLLSISVIFLRIPFFNNLIGGSAIFDAALIIHVNLSVLVWMLSMISLLWCMIVKSENHHIINVIWWVSLIGTCLITFSIFFPISDSIKNNYIPILNNFVFLLGLGMFGIAIFANGLITILFSSVKNSFEIGIYCSAIFVMIAFSCLILAHISIPNGIDIYHFYEYLFWGGGHVLQFAYTQAFIVFCILVLNIKDSKFVNLIFITNILLVLPTIIVYFLYSSYEPILLEFFTSHMKYVGGFLPIVIIVYGIRRIFIIRNIALLCSIILFLYGGVLGLSIDGNNNVTVPAHYHGSIVGITISLMGLSYVISPKLQFAKINVKLSALQISTYGLGQILHISGLAWMGGYGVLRKTATSSILSLEVSIAHIMFILGGLITIFAGLMFIIIMIKSFIKMDEC